MASLHHPRIIGSPAASRKNNQHHAVHEASRQPTQGHAADEPQHITHDMTKPFLHISTFYTPAYITKTLSSGPASSCNTRTQTHQHYQDGPQTLGTQESMEQPLVTCTNRCRNELSRTHPSSHLRYHPMPTDQLQPGQTIDVRSRSTDP